MYRLGKGLTQHGRRAGQRRLQSVEDLVEADLRGPVRGEAVVARADRALWRVLDGTAVVRPAQPDIGAWSGGKPLARRMVTTQRDAPRVSE